MLDEKTMVSDALNGVNGELVRFAEMISQTEHKELKNQLKKMRNECEMSQEKLYNLARQNGFYVPAQKANREDIYHLKSVLNDLSKKTC